MSTLASGDRIWHLTRDVLNQYTSTSCSVSKDSVELPLHCWIFWGSFPCFKDVMKNTVWEKLSVLASTSSAAFVLCPSWLSFLHVAHSKIHYITDEQICYWEASERWELDFSVVLEKITRQIIHIKMQKNAMWRIKEFQKKKKNSHHKIRCTENFFFLTFENVWCASCSELY